MSNQARYTILIIDDDELLCDAIAQHLANGSVEVLIAHTGAEGVYLAAHHHLNVVLLDQSLPDAEGHTLCHAILAHNENAKIIFITALHSFEMAIRALRAGAHNYLAKPFELEELSIAVEQALKSSDLEKIARVHTYDSGRQRQEVVLVGGSRASREIAKLIDLAGSVDAPVLITGETGTGKNVVATAIHHKSCSHDEAFISINCAALPENLIEAELFGYEKGAFTGAVGTKRGLFETAEDGTLFLDEIGEMPMHLQTKLLGALEDKCIRRVGGNTTIPINVRVVAATSSELEHVLDKTFRSDLYYRLSVIRIHIPPLRERRQDIPDLCQHLLAKLVSNRNLKLAPEEQERLLTYDWPGNVRELKNVLERAVIVQPGPELKPSELLENPHKPRPRPEREGAGAQPTVLKLKDVERTHIEQVLALHNDNFTHTAKALGISLSTLKRKLRSYGRR